MKTEKTQADCKEEFYAECAKFHAKLLQINQDTPSNGSLTPPQWWESLSNLERHIGNYLSRGERINYTTSDGRTL